MKKLHLQGKLAQAYFGSKKIQEIICNYEDTCRKVGKRFQSIYTEVVSLTNKLGTEGK